MESPPDAHEWTTHTPPTERPSEWEPDGPFRFLDLPAEIRVRVYEFALVVRRTIDLDPANRRRVAPRLDLLQTCRRVYEEAYPVFYGSHTFRLFPTHGEYFHTKQVLLTRLARKYRQCITSLELRLGPGWSKPPKCWKLTPKLGLKDCTSLRTLKVFVEVDPSHPIFVGFRVSDGFYTTFSSKLLAGMLQQVPTIERVEFDAWPSVSLHSELMQALLAEAEQAKKRLVWGPARGWGRKSVLPCSVEAVDSLQQAMITISI